MGSANSSILETSEQDELDASSLSRQLFYHSLARALGRGSTTIANPRPSLPLELILYIFRLAELVVPSSFNMSCSNEFQVYSAGPLTKKVWFATPPLTRGVLTNVATVKLYTVSSHQGWMPLNNFADGCWSWFELGILCNVTTDNERLYTSTESMQPIDPLLSRLKTRKDGSRLVWRSHSNKLYQQSPGSYDLIEGPTFGPTHELCSHLREGDAIAVIGAAQFTCWSCRGEKAILRFEEYFEPTLPLYPRPRDIGYLPSFAPYHWSSFFSLSGFICGQREK